MSDAKEYIAKKQIPQLFECLMTALMYHRPSDHIIYLQQCLEKIKVQGVSGVRWDLFLEARRTKTPLPPVTPGIRSAKRTSRASSVSELVEKKPVLPPISAVGDKEGKKSQATAAAAAAAFSGNLPRLRVPLTCPVVLLMGGPGCGKRLLCRHLARRYGFASLCVGDLVRAKIRDSHDTRQLWTVAAGAFERGDAVPEELLLPALIEAINEALAGGNCKGILVEGYPQSPAQAEAFASNIKQPDRALLLDFEEDLLQERLLRRYHRLGTVEDQPSNIGRRIAYFRTNGLPTCRLYDEAQKLLAVAVEDDLDNATLFAEAARALDAFYKVIDTTGPDPKPQKGSEDDNKDDAVTAAADSLTAGRISHIADIVNLPSPVKRPADLPQCPIVLVMGGPGSGRSSQASRLAQRYPGFVHINACEEARKRALASGADAAWSALVDIAVQGDLDEEVGVQEMRKLLLQKGRDAKCILLEGYPINESQLGDLYKSVGQPDLTVLLDCEEVYMVRRLLARGKAHGGALGDSLSAVSRRMAYFKERTLPVVRHFDQAGKLCIVLGDRDDTEVFYDLAGLFDYVFFNQRPAHVVQEEQRAADIIKAAFDGFITRQGVAVSMPAAQPAMDEETAAQTVQAAFDAFRTREEFALANAAPQVDEETAGTSENTPFTEDEQAAATRIQAGFRGYQTRKKLTSQQK